MGSPLLDLAPDVPRKKYRILDTVNIMTLLRTILVGFCGLFGDPSGRIPIFSILLTVCGFRYIDSPNITVDLPGSFPHPF